MATVFIDEARLTAIGEAIRGKTGETALLKVADMPAAIEGITTGGGEIPEEALKITGSCQSLFEKPFWNWYIAYPGVYTEDITDGSYLFRYNSTITEVPFDINYLATSSDSSSGEMFRGCTKLTSIGKIVNKKGGSCARMFYDCQSLQYLPEFVNLDMSSWNTTSNGMAGMFHNCKSLRSIPEDVLKQFWNLSTSSTSSAHYQQFNYCLGLDEIRGLVPTSKTDSYVTSNLFYMTFYKCSRVKDIIFATQEDGTPYKREAWHNQTITLGENIAVSAGGWCVGAGTPTACAVTTPNSWWTDRSKEVKDDATYQALKNDPDWWTMDWAYSRYNHDSAVRTINSLPEVAASGTKNNTIIFVGDAGSKTDGGAIKDLTAAEIAVATAKYWTVSIR